MLLFVIPVAAALSAASSSGSHRTAVGVGLATFIPLLFVVGGDVWRRLNAPWQFTVADSPDGLRLRSGLLSTRALTVPPGRIQALRVRQPLFWRPFGWATVHMNVAGVVGRSQTSNRVLVPVAPLRVARGLVEYVLGGIALDSVPVTRPPRRAALCSPLWWRAMAAGSDDRVFVSRHGLIAPTIDVVPNARTQSVRLRAGPWQRIWGLVTLHLDSTRGTGARSCGAPRFIRRTFDARRTGRARPDGAEGSRPGPVDELRWPEARRLRARAGPAAVEPEPGPQP